MKYHAYLLRLWEETADPQEDGVQDLWRCSLERVSAPSKRHGFTSLSALVSFLERVANEGSEESTKETLSSTH